ncbi:XRE family transcriptional regulator (plasmid) [Brucella anthropi]|uniref:helix-turn-helix domain-containing protein n=1 Tax=Brucella anthropi TaxID=529 RepID=UPI001BCD2B8A
MVDTSWKERLEVALEKSGMSLRAASLKAGRGSSYLHGIMAHGKEPSLTALTDVAEALNVSATWLAFGVDLDAGAEELVAQFVKLNPEEQKNILFLTKTMAEKAALSSEADPQ